MELGKKMIAGEVAQVTPIAHALLGSRQSLYKPGRPRPAGSSPRPRLVLRALDLEVPVGPEQMPAEDALVGGQCSRRLWAKLRRMGYVVNRKRVQRLLRLWGYGLTRGVTIRRRRADPLRSPPPTSGGRRI